MVRAIEARPRPAAVPRGRGTTRPPAGIVIFGATGDLARRKLLPALYDLAAQQELPEGFYVLGAARHDWTDNVFREQTRKAVAAASRFGRPSTEAWRSFARHLHYEPFDARHTGTYERLRQRLGALDHEHNTGGNHLFYLAVAPALYAKIVSGLGQAGLAGQERTWTRLVVEKPFGHDLASARQLDAQVAQVFQESQVYRIDHYLGKETVQNLAVFRFANGIFEPLWNRNYLNHVQITVAEEGGVGDRAAYYEQAGALRDMVQNHLLQLLCLVAMEPPAAFDARSVREEKLKVLQAVRPISRTEVERVAVRGQYGPGRLGGRKLPGYREERGVRSDSPTETFAALRLELENWRWAGVPFYLRTGKRLAARQSEISLQFRDAPLHLFACTALQPCPPNLLTLRLAPGEGIGLRIIVKTPGLEVIGGIAEMDFAYGEELVAASPSAYETLLLDALEGDTMLFADAAWVERAWELMEPVLLAWAEQPPRNFPNYPAGSWGPTEADELLARDGCSWLMPPAGIPAPEPEPARRSHRPHGRAGRKN